MVEASEKERERETKKGRQEEMKKERKEKMWSGNIRVIFLFFMTAPFYKFNLVTLPSLNWNPFPGPRYASGMMQIFISQ